LLKEKIQAAKLQSTSKGKIFNPRQEKRYGKADAYHSVFAQYWIKRLLLKRILSYEAPPLPRCFYLFFD